MMTCARGLLATYMVVDRAVLRCSSVADPARLMVPPKQQGNQSLFPAKSGDSTYVFGAGI